MKRDNTRVRGIKHPVQAKSAKDLGKLFESELGGFSDLLDASCVLFEEANTPMSLGLWLRLKYKEYVQYLNASVDPLNYVCPVKFRRDWQCLKVFSKSELLPCQIDTKWEAVKEFVRCEMVCKRVNDAIRRTGFRNLCTDVEWPIIHMASRKLSSILGPAPAISELNFHFGPGLNIGLEARKTNNAYKLSSDRTVTRDCLALIRKTNLHFPRWDASFAEVNGEDPLVPLSPFGEKVVPGSRLTFVPKNAKTDRPICVEPLMNGFLQTGVGVYLKERLRKAGCDLRWQTNNQERSRAASITNGCATVDLSSASDTIPYMVVLELLPIDWFELLDSLRSPLYLYEGKHYPFEKFSSMGNAFTFELESLLFLALTRAVAESLSEDVTQVNVYGDDIICPAKCFTTLKALLGKLGFSVSESKSFIIGPFRESCGKDYFLGEDVRPVFFRGPVTPMKLMVWLNTIHRKAGGNLEDPVMRSWYYSLRNLLPKPFLSLRGPDGYGDGHLVTSYPRGFRRDANGGEGFWYYSIRAVPSYKPIHSHQTVHALAAYAVGRTGLSDSLMQKDSNGNVFSSFAAGSDRYRVTRSCHRWHVAY